MFKMTVQNTFNPAPAVARLEAAGRKEVARAADYVLHRVRANAPVDTGELVASTGAYPVGDGSVWVVYASARHAAPVEFGSMHGPTWIPPNPFFRRALADGRRKYPELLRNAIVAGMGQLAGPSSAQTKG